MFKKKSLLIFFLITLIFFYCSKKTDKASSTARLFGLLANLFNSFQAAPAIKNISENFIYSNYAILDTKVNALKSLTSVMPDSCGSDTTKLTSIQALWKSAFITLKQIEIVQFGASGSYTTIDSWPANYSVNPPDVTKIEATIAGTESISETNLSSKVDNENGFPAIEYLLFDNGAGSGSVEAICSALTGRRKLYLQEAVKLLSARITRISFNWNPNNSGNFSLILQTAGANNEFYKSDKEVLDTLIKQIVLMVEKMKDDKIGYAAGLTVNSSGIVRSNFVEARFANLSISAISDNLTGLYAFYIGNDGPGISDYVRYYNVPLDERIRAKIRQVQSKTLEIKDLKAEVGSGNTTKIKELYLLLNELKILFTVELAGNLGSSLTPGLGGGDGD